MTHYFAHDAKLNNTAVFVTNINAIERCWSCSACGEPAAYDANFAHDGDGVSDIANSTTFTGRSLDTETGLYYYRNRYYHSQLGRFVGRDPIGYAAIELNLYQYVKALPPTKLDPSGEQFLSPDGEMLTDSLSTSTQPRPPVTSGSSCEIRIYCRDVLTGGGTINAGTHCGITMYENGGQTQLDRPPESPLRIVVREDDQLIHEGDRGHATHRLPPTSYGPGACDCLKSYKETFDAAQLDRNNSFGNSNLVLNCMLSHCGIDVPWGSPPLIKPDFFDSPPCAIWKDYPETGCCVNAGCP